MKKYIFAAFLLSIILSSCENFLQGADTKQKLERVVNYANAPGCTVALRSDESMGTFVAGDSKEFKVGVDEDIYFTANIENCYFAGLKSVSISDSAKDMSEYVEIKVTDRDDQKGLYKINVTILKQAPDIVLTPVCYFYPEVVSYTPSDSNASFANMPVVITFNVPMEKEEVTPVQSIFNYDNISLECASKDVSKYFEKPYFNAQKTVLTLKPKASFVEYLQSTNEQIINMDITFGENIYVIVDDIKLQIKQNEKGYITVTYKPEAETIPPVKTGFGFFASKEELPLDTVMGMTDSEIDQIRFITEAEYPHLAVRSNRDADEYKSKVIQNLNPGTIYLYGRYFDEDSGVDKITVYEKNVNDKTGLLITDSNNSRETNYFLEDSETLEYKQNGKVFLFRIKHILPDNPLQSDNKDGAYNLTVSVKDRCNNTSESETFTSIKDSKADLSKIQIFNVSNDRYYPGRGDKVAEYIGNNTYNDVIKTIKFIDTVNNCYADVENPEPVEFSIKYKNKNNQEITERITNCYPNPQAPDELMYDYTLNVDHVYNTSFELIAKNSLGTESYRTYNFPPRPVIVKDMNYILIPEDKRITHTHEIIQDGGNYSLNVSSERATSPVVVLSNDSSWDTPDAVTEYVYENNMLFSEACDGCLYITYSFDPLNYYSALFDPDISVLTFKDVCYEVNPDSDGYNLVIELPDDIWAKVDYDHIVVYENYIEDEWSCWPCMIINRGVTKKTILLKPPLSRETYFCLAGYDGISRSDYTPFYGFIVSEEEINKIDADRKQKQKPRLDDQYMFMLYGAYYSASSVGYSNICKKFGVTNMGGNAGDIQIIVNDTYQYNFDAKLFGAQKKDALCIYTDYESMSKYESLILPIGDWTYGNNKITISLINHLGTATQTETLYLTKSPVIFNNPGTISSNSYVLKSKPTNHEFNKSGQDNIYVSYLDSEGWHDWGKYGFTTIPDLFPVDGTVSTSNSGNSEKPYIHSITLPLSQQKNKYIKVVSAINYEHEVSEMVFYNGTASSGSATDKIIKNGDYYFVYSDQPVYISTVLTKHPLNECKDWSVEEWEGLNELHLIYNEQYINFTPEQYGTPGIYILDDRVPATGDCYVIIAHFADGHTIMSPVMIK
ncbi:MAG: hypothetical protein IKN54_08710 [Lachnospiraceae bacterium]|nr:hypothetical protein [Lachnospiraceae bacterium]